MDQHFQDPNTEITFHHEPADSTSRIWRTFWILTALTVAELGLGFAMYGFEMPSWLILAIKGIICILTLAKAFWIVSVFMHLGDEIRNLIMTIIVPLMLFVWFIGAFLWDGNSYRNLRNRYDETFREQYKTPTTQDHTSDTLTVPHLK